MIKAAFFCNGSNIDIVYGMGRKEKIEKLTELYPEIITEKNFDKHINNLRDIEVIFSTWGMLKLTKEQIEKLSSLKAVFYAAGSVKHFAIPFLEKGITIVSGYGANAIPVAEFALAQILLSAKGYFQNLIDYKKRNFIKPRGKGNFGIIVGIIGCGMVGTRLIELLKNFDINIIVYDPYLSDEKAKELRVENVSLEDLFKRAYIVSNHAPDTAETERMIDGNLLRMMGNNTTFINTGRGKTVVEDDLIAVLKERPDFTALLDVTFPEPAANESELYNLPNAYLSGHIAGSIGDEVVRMADYCINEFESLNKGEPIKYKITIEMLMKLA